MQTNSIKFNHCRLNDFERLKKKKLDKEIIYNLLLIQLIILINNKPVMDYEHYYFWNERFLPCPTTLVALPWYYNKRQTKIFL